MHNDYDVCDLRDVPHLIDAVVRQNFETWGAFTDLDLAGMNALFCGDLQMPRDSLPVTLVIVDDAGEYAGVVSLRPRSMGALTHPEAYIEGVGPWLSNMWVAERLRGRGVAQHLCAAIEQAGVSLGITRIYSSTMTPRSLYHKRGYTDIRVRPYREETLFIIEKSL